MSESRTLGRQDQRQGQRDRDAAADKPRKRVDYQAGANGEQNIDAAAADADDPNAADEGQLGPDEISEPDEVIKNNQAKKHSSAPHEPTAPTPDEPYPPMPPRNRDIPQDDAKSRGEDTRPDHSEREWGGDQDIDTAGMVPGNKATKNE